VFQNSSLPFFRDVLLYAAAAVVSVAASRFLILQIGLGNDITGFLFAGVISVACCMAVYILLFFKTVPFREATAFFTQRFKK